MQNRNRANMLVKRFQQKTDECLKALASLFTKEGCLNAAATLRGHNGDLVAGLSVIGLLIPEAVAYAGIAGMPPAAGLIALFCGLLCYAVFGFSRFAIVSATSSSAMVLAVAVGTLSAQEHIDPETLAAVLVIMTGFWFVLARILGFGQAANFVAKPVLRGVTMGIALTITLTQIPKLLGLHPEGTSPWHKLWDTASLIHTVSPTAAAVGLVSLAILLLWRWPRQPASLWVVIASVAATFFLPLADMGVELVGDISLRRSALSITSLANADWLGAIQMSAALCLMVYAESYSSIHSSASRHGDPTNSNRDILALGISNLVSGFCGGLAVGAGFSATSLNDSAGAQSKLSGVVALAIFTVAVLFLLPMVSRIPEPVLAAVVIKAVSHGLSWQPMKPYFVWRRDRLLVVSSFLAVALLGVLNGLLVSVVLSVAFILINEAKPRVSELRRLPGSHSYVNKNRYTGTLTEPEILVLRLDQPMFFANAAPALKKAGEELDRCTKDKRISTIVISMEESPDLDGTSIEAFIVFAAHMHEKGVRVILCRLHQRAREAMIRARSPYIPVSHLSSLSVDRAVKYALESQKIHLERMNRYKKARGLSPAFYAEKQEKTDVPLKDNPPGKK